MSSLEDVAQRLARKTSPTTRDTRERGRKAGPDAYARLSVEQLLGRLAVIEDVTDAVAERGSQPECNKVRESVWGASMELVYQGASQGTAAAVARMLTALWSWLNAAALTAAQREALAAVEAAGGGAAPGGSAAASLDPARTLAAAAHVLRAVGAAAHDMSLEGSLAPQLLEAAAAALPLPDKMPGSVCKTLALSVLSQAAVLAAPSVRQTLRSNGAGAAAASSGAAALFKGDSSRLVKAALKAARDKDAAVRAAGYRCVAHVAAAAPLASPAFEALLAAAVRAVQEERNEHARAPAAECLASVLHAAASAPASAAAAKKNPLLAAATAARGGKKADAAAFGPVGPGSNPVWLALCVLRGCFARAVSADGGGGGAEGACEAAALAAAVFLQKCFGAGAEAPACAAHVSAREAVRMLLGFVGATAADGGAAEWRSVAAAVAQWCTTLGSDEAVVQVACGLRERLLPPAPEASAAAVAGSAAAAAATASAGVGDDGVGPVDPQAVAALYALTDVLQQLALGDALRQDMLGALLSFGSRAPQGRLRADVALAVKGLLGEASLATDCHYLVSLLIYHSGNALCGVGTPCDHEAVRWMLTAASCLLALLPCDPLGGAGSSIQLQLTELCSVAWLHADGTAAAEDASAAAAAQPATGGVRPIDPQLRVELACLLEACLACCGGFAALHGSLPKLSQRTAAVLRVEKAATFPRNRAEAAASFARRGAALLGVVAVLRFARRSGRDLAPLAACIDPDFLPALEDTLGLLHSRLIAWSDERLDAVLCGVRALAFEAVALLPQLPRSGSLYELSARAAVGCVAILSGTPSSLLPALLRGTLPPHEATRPSFVASSNIRPAAAEAPGGGVACLSTPVGDWHRVVRPSAARQRAGGPLTHERERVAPLTQLLDSAVRCLAVVFARQGKANRRSVVDRLAENMARSTERVAKGKATTADRTNQLNTMACLLAALTRAAASPACREVAWAADPELLKVVRGCVAMARAVLGAPCVLTRCAAGEVVGLAAALGGQGHGGAAASLESFDAHLPAALAAARGAEAAGLAHAIGALHARDREGRADMVGLSLSYLRQLARRDYASAPAPKERSGGGGGLVSGVLGGGGAAAAAAEEAADAEVAVLPHVLTALSRVVIAAGAAVAPFSDAAAMLAAERVVRDVPATAGDAAAKGGGVDYDAACVSAALDVVGALAAALPAEDGLLDAASLAATTSRSLLLLGLNHTDSLARATAHGVLAFAAAQRADAALRLNVPALLGQLLAELSTVDATDAVPRGSLPQASGAAKAHAVAALCGALHALCAADAGKAAEALGPRQLLHLSDAACARGGPPAPPSGGQQPSPGVGAGGADAQQQQQQQQQQAQGLLQEAAHCVLQSSVELLASPSEERRGLGCVRLREWVDEVHAAVAGAGRRAATKVSAMQLLAALLATLVDVEAAATEELLAPCRKRLFALCLGATEKPGPLRGPALASLASLVVLCGGLEDDEAPSDDAGGGGGGGGADPDLRTRSVLVRYARQLCDAAGAGLAPALPGHVQYAAAQLAAATIKSCILPPTEVSKLFSMLVKCFAEQSADELVNVGVTSAAADVVLFARGIQEARLRGSMSPERMVSLAKTGQSLPLAVLRQIRGRGAEPRPVAEAAAVLDIEELEKRAGQYLRNLCVMTGVGTGWMSQDRTQHVPRLDTARFYMKSCPMLLQAISCDESQLNIASGVCCLLLSRASRGPPPAACAREAVALPILQALEAVLRQGHAAIAAYACGLAAVLYDRAQMLHAALQSESRLSQEASVVRCLGMLLPTLEAVGAYDATAALLHSQTVRLVVSASGRLLPAAHACFAALAPPAAVRRPVVLRSRTASRVAVSCMEASCTAAAAAAAASSASASSADSARLLLPFALEVLRRGLAAGADAPAVAAAAREGCVRVLSAAATPAAGSGGGGGTPDDSAQRRAVKGFLLALCEDGGRAGGASAAHWLAFVAAWCVLEKGGGRGGADDVEVTDAAWAALREGVASGEACVPEGLLSGLQYVKAHGRGDAAAVRAMGGVFAAAGAAVVVGDAPETKEGRSYVMLGATLLLSTVALLKATLDAEAADDAAAVLSAAACAVAALSAGAAKSTSRCHPLACCILELAQRLPDLFRSLIPHLDPACVLTLRRQMAAAQQGSTHVSPDELVSPQSRRNSALEPLPAT